MNKTASKILSGCVFFVALAALLLSWSYGSADNGKPPTTADASGSGFFDGNRVENAQLSSRTTPNGVCPAGSNYIFLYYESFESGEAGWTHNGTGDTWALSASNPFMGAYSWLGVDVPAPSDQRLISPEIYLPSGQNPLYLAFWSARDIEKPSSPGCYDGGILESSADHGATWTQIGGDDLITDPYDGTINPNFSNPLGGLQAWCGVKSYTQPIVDISDMRGQAISFRFRLGTDLSGGRPGWWIDEVAVVTCLPERYLPIVLR